jgi:hypothetical protein
MTERKMSPKGFLHKTTTKAAASATAFLAQHRAWLETGELALFTTPILRKLDEKAIMPTPALEEIKVVVLAHHLAEETRKAEEAMVRADQPKVRKNYIATVYNSKGEVQYRENGNTGEPIELVETFDLSTQAEGWADRRLFDGASDWFAVIEATKMFRKDGEPLATTIMRDDAIARILRVKKGPVMKSKPQSTSKLSFGVKAKGDHVQFSRG